MPSDLLDGQRVFMVRWGDGEPHISAGVVVGTGLNGSFKKARFLDRGKLIGSEWFSQTMAGAVHKALIRAADLTCSPGIFGKTEWSGNSRQLIYRVTRLVRLIRKLQKHHLWR